MGILIQTGQIIYLRKIIETLRGPKEAIFAKYSHSYMQDIFHKVPNKVLFKLK